MEEVQSNTQRRKEEAKAAMAETRRRSARISSYVDMIPSRFYLGFECPQVKGIYKTSGAHAALDPQAMKRTSQLVEEAAAAAEQVEKPSAAGGSKGSQERRKKKESNGHADSQVSTSNSRSELRSKLEQRIAELKEERRRKQSETDSARVAKAKDPQAKRPAPAEVQDDFEAGKLDFDLKKSELPFEAGVNKRGNKIQKLRANLRAEEKGQKRIAEAGSKGEDPETIRKEIEMEKALKRTQGLPVHDDISRLRKSQKMLERKKRVGKDRWEKREAAEKDNAEWKQQKRKDNLKAQRQGKKKKKGRVGFEGAKSGFLNSDK